MKRTILVVEDSPTQAERVRLLLEDHGYQVEVARDGHEGLERVRRRPVPDLIISDLIMPRMDGYEFCRAVKSAEKTKRIPFVLLTDRRNAIDIITGLERGADNFITKPFEDDYLLERIRRIFEQLEFRRNGHLEMQVALRVGARQIVLSADKQQIIELLFSTFEEMCLLNGKLTESQHAIEAYAQDLETRVAERTHELSESEQRSRLLFEANPYPVLVFDAETLRFLAVNDTAVKHYGYSLDEFLAMTILDIRPPEDIPRALDALGEAGLAHRGPWQHRKKDGTIIDVEITFQVVDLAGRSAQMLLVRDITGLKRAAEEKESLEAQLRQAQKMEAVGRLAGGVAHDFNNLLTVIMGRGHILQRRLGAEDPGRRDVELIQQSAERAARLTRQLLAFSRKQVLEPKVVDLSQVVTVIEPLLRRLIGEDVTIAVGTQQGLGRVKADPGQIEQVILNLAVNSRDAMPRGGRLTIETANVELDEAYVARYPELTPGPYVMLAVSDTGTGMDAAVQAQLFEPFFTTKEPGKGTGLGLATVFGIVKQSGGHIAVYSEPGRGSTLKVYLPRVDDVPEAVEGMPTAVSAPRGSETLLLVEDEDDLRELAAEVLRAWGYTVLETDSPAEALLLAKRHEGSIHLLVTDVVLPGMSGRDLADRLLADRPGVRTLFMSGYTDAAIVHHGVLEPGTPFLPKPFTPDALTRKVRDVLDQR